MQAGWEECNAQPIIQAGLPNGSPLIQTLGVSLMNDKPNPAGFLNNIAVSIRATGPAAVLVSWVLGVTLLGIFGQGEVASRAITILSVAGGLLIAVLGQRA